MIGPMALPPSLTGIDIQELVRQWRIPSEQDGPGALVDLESLEDEDVVVALGAPGMGKTTELWRWHLRSENSHWVDLGLLENAASLAQQCIDHEVVFVDSCDEYMGEAGPLLQSVGEIRRRGTKIRLSSRAAWWGAHRHLHGQLQSHTLVELQPLDDSAIRVLLDDGSGVQAGLEVVSSADHSITRNPRMLVALRVASAESGRLLTNRAEIYEELAAAAVTEHNAAIAEATPADPSDALRMAKWCAAALLLTDRTVITTEVLPRGDQRLSLAALRADAGLNALSAPIDPGAVLHSHLMTPCSGGYRFLDRSLTEYLAASVLAELLGHRRDDEQDVWRTLLTIDVAGETFVPPRLRGVAAWLAELSATAFDVVFMAEPSVLLENDLASHSDAGASRLFRAVLGDDVLLRSASYSTGVLSTTYIAADGFDEIERRLDRSNSWEVRRRALEFVRGAQLRAFDEHLIVLILDGTDDAVLRYWASASLSTAMSGEHLACLREGLLSGTLPDDEDHRILGAVLKVLWPDLLSAEEVFEAMVPPTSGGVLEYEMFIALGLVQNLTTDDVDSALIWIAQTLESDDWSSRRYDAPVKGVLERVVERLSKVGSGPERDSTLRCFGRLVLASVDERIDVTSPVRGLLNLSDLKILAAAIVSHDDGSRGPGEWVIAELVRDSDAGVIRDLLRWIARQVWSNDASSGRWVRVFDTILDPWRDRAIVDELLDLTGKRREPFASLIDPVELQSVPDYLRRRRSVKAEAEAEFEKDVSHLVARVLGEDEGWLKFVMDAVSRHHLMRTLADADHLSELSEDQWMALAVAADDYSLAFEPPPARSIEAGIVTAGELSFAHAMALLHHRKLIGPSDRRLLVGQQTLFRCQGFARSPAYDDLMRASYDADPDRLVVIAESEIEAITAAETDRQVDWIGRFPGGAPPSLLEAAISLVVSGGGTDKNRVTVLREIVGINDEALQDRSEDLLSNFRDTEHYGAAAVAMLGAGLSLSELGLTAFDTDSAKQVISGIACAREFREDPGALDLADFDSAELASLYRLATELFPRFAIPRSGWTMGHDDPYRVDELRAGCLRQLAARGPDGVKILRFLAVGQPLAAILGVETLRVLVDDWWEPLQLNELIRILSDPGADVVRSADELLSVVRRAIHTYDESLRAIGGGAELLWEAGTPRLETELSIDLMRYLRLFFARSNVILNREVELRPASMSDSIRGERSDILLQAAHVDRPPISLVVEIKGSWNDQKYTGYQRQLVDRYLAHDDVGAGLHVVFWFGRASWDIDDSQRNRSPQSKEQVLRQLQRKKPESSKPIDHVVIDGSR